MEFVIDFDRTADVPLYRSLSNAIKTAISDGRLRPGDKIPSVRVLCELADVSRNTAHQCYQTLISEGVVESVQGKGVFVSKPLTNDAGQPAKGHDPVREAQRTAETPAVHTPFRDTIFALENSVMTHQSAAIALRHQMPALEDLPLQTLGRAFAKHAKFGDPSLLVYTDDPLGHLALREAIANYVLRARGIKCTAEQVIVTSRPSQQLLDMFCRLFLSSGDWAAVEYPGYCQPRQIFQLHNARILRVPVDDDGLQVDALVGANKPVKIVYTTPSHQDPMGGILSPERRKQLVAWAQRTNAMIWEDDFDNEYRYGSEPIPALYALDQGNNVIYQSTFWRTLCPLIRMGFIIVPPNRTKEFLLAKYLLDRDFPIIEQLVMADLINEGHFERHVRTMRKKFTSRRQTAVHQLKIKLGDLVTICRSTSGLHLRALFDASVPKEIVRQCGFASGLAITSTDAYYVGESPSNEFLIQFAHTDEAELERQIEIFASRLKTELGRTC